MFKKIILKNLPAFIWNSVVPVPEAVTIGNTFYITKYKIKIVFLWQKEKARDFKQHIVKYLESLLHTQHRVSVCLLVFLHTTLLNCLSWIAVYLKPVGEVLGGLPAWGQSHRLIRALTHMLLTFDLDNRQSTFLSSYFLCSLCVK